MQYIVFHLSSKKDQGKVIKTFKALDRDSNGNISRDEFYELYAKLPKSKGLTAYQIELEVDMIWQRVDLDGSGSIDYTEWALGTATPKDTVLSEKKLRQAFALFDQDTSGRVQFSELKAMLSPLISNRLSEEEWK
jgi:Ca2+-binding EF-hand superfamily protein